MLSKQLRKLLTERGIAVAELARQSGVGKTNIHSWLAGGNPNATQLVKVAKSLGVSTDFLLTGEKHSEPNIDKLISAVEIYNGQFEITIKKIKKDRSN